MSRLGPLLTAVTVFPLIALAAAVPYVAHQYRRRGTVGAGHLLITGALALYLVGLAFSVILPLRPVTPDFCALYEVEAHYSPLRMLGEIREETTFGAWRALLGSEALQSAVLNVFLFVPLGMFARHLFGLGMTSAVAAGFGVSLAIELTQLTGNWFLYPCPYRYFDTADLLLNSAGSALGAAAAPLLRLVPAQLSLRDPGDPQPVTPPRRLLGALCDVAAVVAVGVVLMALAGLVLELTRGQLFESDSIRAHALRSILLVVIPGLLVTLAAPLAFGGRTPGQWAVLIRPAAPGGGALSSEAVVRRFLTGAGPLILLVALGVLGLEPAWIAAAILAGTRLAVAATARRDAGGAALLRSGQRLEDARRP